MLVRRLVRGVRSSWEASATSCACSNRDRSRAARRRLKSVGSRASSSRPVAWTRRERSAVSATSSMALDSRSMGARAVRATSQPMTTASTTPPSATRPSTSARICRSRSSSSSCRPSSSAVPLPRSSDSTRTLRSPEPTIPNELARRPCATSIAPGGTANGGTLGVTTWPLASTICARPPAWLTSARASSVASRLPLWAILNNPVARARSVSSTERVRLRLSTRNVAPASPATVMPTATAVARLILARNVTGATWAPNLNLNSDLTADSMGPHARRRLRAAYSRRRAPCGSGGCRHRLQLAAQVADEDFQGVLGCRQVAAPHPVQDHRTGKDLAGVADEQLEQQELGTGELEAPTAPEGLVARGAKGEVREAEAFGGRPTVAHRPAQQRLQPGKQLDEREGFDDVVVGAGVEALDPVAHGLAGGEHEDGGVVARPPKAPADLEAVGRRHHQVEDDDVRGVGIDRGQGLAAVTGEADGAALEAQGTVQGRADGWVVGHSAGVDDDWRATADRPSAPLTVPESPHRADGEAEHHGDPQ